MSGLPGTRVFVTLMLLTASACLVACGGSGNSTSSNSGGGGSGGSGGGGGGSGGGGGTQPPGGYSISGTISGATQITVTLEGAASKNEVTDQNGRFSFTGLADGAYVLRPSASDFAFDPISTAVLLPRDDQGQFNFTATATPVSSPTFTAAGTLRPVPSSPLVLGLIGQMNPNAGKLVATTIVDVSGHFSFSGIPPGSYDYTLVAPGRMNPQCTLFPSWASIQQDLTGLETSATCNQTISGKISVLGTGSVKDILVELWRNGDRVASTSTFEDGTFAFYSRDNGTYTIKLFEELDISPSDATRTVDYGDPASAEFTLDNSKPVLVLFTTTGTFTGNLGGRGGADTKCDNDRASLGLTCNTVRAILSVSEDDTVAGMAGKWSLPATIQVRRPSGVIIAPSWNSMFSTDLANSIDSGSGDTWTGSTETGALSHNCRGWTSSERCSSLDDCGEGGGTTVITAGNWIHAMRYSCDNPHRLLCACW